MQVHFPRLRLVARTRAGRDFLQLAANPLFRHLDLRLSPPQRVEQAANALTLTFEMPPHSRFKLPLRGKSRSGSGSAPSHSSSRKSSAFGGLCTHSSRSSGTARPRIRVFAPNSSNGSASRTPGLAHEVRPEAEGDDDTLDEVIMAVDLQHRDTVGCCYYVAQDEKLYFMEDVKFGGVDVVDARTSSAPLAPGLANKA